MKPHAIDPILSIYTRHHIPRYTHTTKARYGTKIPTEEVRTSRRIKRTGPLMSNSSGPSPDISHADTVELDMKQAKFTLRQQPDATHLEKNTIQDQRNDGGEEDTSPSSESDYRKRKNSPFHQMMTNYIPHIQMHPDAQKVFSEITKPKRTHGDRKECQEVMEMFTLREMAYRLRKAEERAAEKRGDKFREPPLKELPIRYTEKVSSAYVFDRFFENYGLIYNILKQVKKRLPGPIVHFNPQRVFDFGTGAGSALWAAKSVFPELKEAVGCDISEKMLEMARDFSGVRGFAYQNIDFQQYLSFPQSVPEDQCFDIVISAFSLQDLPNDTERQRVLSSLWKRTSKNGVLVLAEPGNELGFHQILKARSYLTDLQRKNGEDIHIVAPCPHSFDCPLAKEKFTCAFTQTVEYPVYLHLTHQKREGAIRKPTCSFVVFSKSPVPSRNRDQPPAEELPVLSTTDVVPLAYQWPRILNPPSKEKGHTLLDVCTPSGKYERWTARRKVDGKAIYKDSRKARSGDLWPFESNVRIDKLKDRTCYVSDAERGSSRKK